MERTPKHGSRWLLILGIAALTLLGTTGLAEESDAEPLLDEVVRMLEQGVSSAWILDWLDDRTAQAAALGADDMIRLSRAEASDELVRRLMELSQADPPATPLTATPRSLPEQSSTDRKVDFAIYYRPQWHPDTEYPWDLYVYLDGQLLARVVPQTGLGSKPPTELRRRIEPGRHTLRWIEENHDRRERKGVVSWRHDARVSPDAVEFELGAGAGWSVELRWIEPRFEVKRQGPVSWEVTRDGERQDGADVFGVRREDWEYLCDDMEANVPEGQKTPAWVRRTLKHCVRWGDLWPETIEPPSRDALRDELAAYEYRPPANVTVVAGSEGSDP